jgi:hypothetical protein
LSGCCSVLLPLLLLLLLLASGPVLVLSGDVALLAAAPAASERLVCMRGSTVLKGAIYSAGVMAACGAALYDLFDCLEATFPSLRAALHRHRLIGTPRSKLNACPPVACKLRRLTCCVTHFVFGVLQHSDCIAVFHLSQAATTVLLRSVFQKLDASVISEEYTSDRRSKTHAAVLIWANVSVGLFRWHLPGQLLRRSAINQTTPTAHCSLELYFNPTLLNSCCVI